MRGEGVEREAELIDMGYADAGSRKMEGDRQIVGKGG